ncbi:hypothetical protein BX666DRAFT_1231800 [Dichotomocladium elegans]|nr:hypothetical protein BX666DRAFT_1231800 [Dichotomocladium elegans]
MTTNMDPSSSQLARIFACTQCPKMFATRSNLKRHMENPNIHNIPYVRSRDQKRWKGHAKKVVSKEETTERMRKWRAENREKNRQNDLRCRVYRLARQKYGEHDSPEKQQFVRDEITRRLGRRMMLEQKLSDATESSSLVLPRRGRRIITISDHHHRHHHTHHNHNRYRNDNTMIGEDVDDRTQVSDLPFYSAPQQKIELPSIGLYRHPSSSSFYLDSPSSGSSSPTLPDLSPSWHSEHRTSSSASTVSSIASESYKVSSPTTTATAEDDEETGHADYLTLPSMHSLLSFTSRPFDSATAARDEEDASDARSVSPTATSMSTTVRYVEQTKILDEFVGVVLNYVAHPTHDERTS